MVEVAESERGASMVVNVGFSDFRSVSVKRGDYSSSSFFENFGPTIVILRRFWPKNRHFS